MTLYLGNNLGILFCGIYYMHLPGVYVGVSAKFGPDSTFPNEIFESTYRSSSLDQRETSTDSDCLQDASVAEEFIDDGTEPSVTRIDDMHAWQRFRTVRGLWLKMIPLFVVFASEYATGWNMDHAICFTSTATGWCVVHTSMCSSMIRL